MGHNEREVGNVGVISPERSGTSTGQKDEQPHTDALAWLEDEPDLYDDVGPTTPPDDIQSSDALAWLEDEPDLYDDVIGP